MPRAESRPPGSGDVRIGRARARPLQLRFRPRYVPQITTYVQRFWQPHPISVASAIALGDLYGRGISGHAGTISTGASRNGAGPVADPAVGFAGYAQPPQLFVGWNPRNQTKVGTPIKTPGGLPDTSTPLGTGSPLDNAMLAIMAGSGDG